MSINWGEGRITPEQHILREEQRMHLVKGMQLNDVRYAPRYGLIAGDDGGLWLDGDVRVFTREEVINDDLQEEHDLICVYKLEPGLVIDVTHDPIENGEKHDNRIPVDVTLAKEGAAYIEVVGVIETEE